ncbi:hypothetical protein HDU84_002133 [Entophlyctis sp. JEL0112]|nr:hypothetical protein HDU84_002133 [Entophlyctis sp. JEL0112]
MTNGDATERFGVATQCPAHASCVSCGAGFYSRAEEEIALWWRICSSNRITACANEPKWYHWNCISPDIVWRIRENDHLEGYEHLPPVAKFKIHRAMVLGRVDLSSLASGPCPSLPFSKAKGGSTQLARNVQSLLDIKPGDSWKDHIRHSHTAPHDPHVLDEEENSSLSTATKSGLLESVLLNADPICSTSSTKLKELQKFKLFGCETKKSDADAESDTVSCSSSLSEATSYSDGMRDSVLTALSCSLSPASSRVRNLNEESGLIPGSVTSTSKQTNYESSCCATERPECTVLHSSLDKVNDLPSYPSSPSTRTRTNHRENANSDHKQGLEAAAKTGSCYSRLKLSSASTIDSYLAKLNALAFPLQNKLERLPEGYVLYDRMRDQGNRVDKYLLGHPSGRKFRSVLEFVPHAQFMVLGDEGHRCNCILCDPSSVRKRSRKPSSLKLSPGTTREPLTNSFFNQLDKWMYNDIVVSFNSFSKLIRGAIGPGRKAKQFFASRAEDIKATGHTLMIEDGRWKCTKCGEVASRRVLKKHLR